MPCQQNHYFFIQMVALYKDPSGEVVFNTQSVNANPTNTLTQKSNQFGEQSPAYVTGLETRVRELEMKLKQISEVMHALIISYKLHTVTPILLQSGGRVFVMINMYIVV